MNCTLKRTLHGIISREIARDPKAPAALKDYLVSCIMLVRQRTPTMGDLCKSFQLRIPTNDVLKVCDVPEPCECAHLAEKYGIPTVDGHCVTRDFEWLPLYSSGTDPGALTQNLKNALLPQWNHIRNEVHSNLRRTLRDIPILGNKDHLSLSAMVAVQGFYSGLLATTPKTHHLSHVKKQLRQLPVSWITGWFDKGTSAVWAGCKNFWYPRFKKAFFQQPKRFSELLRTHTPAEASEQAFRYIVSGAKSFLSDEPDPLCNVNLQPDLCARLCMLQSWIPSAVKKCLHHLITPETKLVNVQRVLNLLSKTDMPQQWWTGNLRKSLNKWGEPHLCTVTAGK